MKTADEMFEELGYEKTESKHHIIFEKGAPIISRIIFSRLTKTVCGVLIGEDYDVWKDGMDIDMQELQAINKKVEELKWI